MILERLSRFKLNQNDSSASKRSREPQYKEDTHSNKKISLAKVSTNHFNNEYTFQSQIPTPSTPDGHFIEERVDSAKALSIAATQSPVPFLIPTLSKSNLLSEEFAELSLKKHSNQNLDQASFTHNDIFEIPEILELIIKYLLDFETEKTPRERILTRRPPQSYQHALMMYKNKEHADKVWNQLQHQKAVSQTQYNSQAGACYSYMLVNKLWLAIVREKLLKNLYFQSDSSYLKFHEAYFKKGPKLKKFKPTNLIFHKLHKLKQKNIEKLSEVIELKELKWLEFYICPSIVPSLTWFTERLNKLERLALPGNKVIDNDFLIEISSKIPNLEVLDLRACDKVGDSGLVSIVTKCSKLHTVNLGRHRNSHLITGVSVMALAQYTQIRTLGVAGCDVNDASIWELAELRGKFMERLSLNGCQKLSNLSLPILFKYNYFPNLSVLEIRNLEGVTDFKPIVVFKLAQKARKRPILLESCPRILKIIHTLEKQVKHQNTSMIRRDMMTWINDRNDGDIDWVK